MLTVNDITSLCPVSEKPGYLVFERHFRKPEFWKVLTLTNDQVGALEQANAIESGGEEAFVTAFRFEEAQNIRMARDLYTDEQVAHWRSPYPMAAE